MNKTLKFFSKFLIFATLFSCTQNNNILKTTPSTIIPSTQVAQISPAPTVNPVPQVSKTPEVTSPSPLATPSPSATSSSSVTTDISSYATLNGKVYDPFGNVLNDILISINSLDKNKPFSAETKTIQGEYVFRNVPAGTILEVTAFKDAGWTTRKQSLVLKSNITGEPQNNVLNFGDSYSVNEPSKSNFYFLSDAPEVIEVSPRKNSVIDKNDGVSIKLTFSENVLKKSVENNFVFRYVSQNFPGSTILGDGKNGTSNTDGPPSINNINQVIFDKNEYISSFEWDTQAFEPNGKIVTFSLNSSTGFPVKKDSNVIYGISLRGNDSSPRLLDSANTNALDKGEFFIDGNRSRNILFLLAPDTTEPYLKEVKLLKTGTQRKIRLTFSEPMVVKGNNNEDLLDISNYSFYKNSSATKFNPVSPALELYSPYILDILCDMTSFSDSDFIKVAVNPNIKDPVGNFMSQGQLNGEPDNIKTGRYN